MTCCLLIIFAVGTHIRPDILGPDLNPNCLIWMVSPNEFFEVILKKNQQTTKESMQNYQACHISFVQYSKTCVKRPLSKSLKFGFQDQLSLNAGQKYCRMLQEEHSAIYSTFIKLLFVIKIFVSYIFDWPFYTAFTVIESNIITRLCNHSFLSFAYMHLTIDKTILCL